MSAQSLLPAAPPLRPGSSVNLHGNQCGSGTKLKDGLRWKLYELYAPLNHRKWMTFVKDCNVLSVTTSKVIHVFDQTKVMVAKQRKKKKKKSKKLRDGASEEELSYEEFGICVHKLAGIVYDKDPNPCARFNYLHLLPLVASREDIDVTMISYAQVELAKWRQAKETRSGLDELFKANAKRGGALPLKGFQSILRSTGLFPDQITLVNLQDAFFETLLDCTWEDAICNQAQKSQICMLSLNLATFVECLCRSVMKGSSFPPGSSDKDLVRLLDQTLFPRRYLRKFRHQKQSRPKILELGSVGASDSDPESDDDDEADDAHASAERFQEWASFSSSGPKSPSKRVNRRRKPTKSSGANPAFKEFHEKTINFDQRKVAKTKILEFLEGRGIRTGLPRTQSKNNMPSPLLAEMKRQQQLGDGQGSRASSSGNGHYYFGGGMSPASGFVSLEEHNVVLTKLAALEDALDLGLNDLDWDGTLEDAELKMQELFPLMMSEDPKEQAEASDKFEKLDKIVRNHKDYKEREKRKRDEWEEENAPLNQTALEELQAIFPKCIAEGTAMKDLTEIFNMTPALAKRAFQCKALRMIHMDKEEIAKMHVADLCGSYSTQGLDIRELRAVYASLPDEFNADGDGRKANWKESLFGNLQEMVRKEQAGSLMKNQIRHPAYSAPGLKGGDSSEQDEEGKAFRPPPISTVTRSGPDLLSQIKTRGRRSSTGMISGEPVSPGATSRPAPPMDVMGELKAALGKRLGGGAAEEEDGEEQEEHSVTNKKTFPPKKKLSVMDDLRAALQKRLPASETKEADQQQEHVQEEEESKDDEETSSFTERRRQKLSRQNSISAYVQKCQLERSNSFSSEVGEIQQSSSAKRPSTTRSPSSPVVISPSSPVSLVDELSAVLKLRSKSQQ